MMRFAALVALLVACVAAKDPAQGWQGYATATNPAGGDAVITRASAYWTVPSNPLVQGAFFSPWFGIESSDNLNLIQPVNPWSGDSWSIYNEYFQWSPENNENSPSVPVNAGDKIYGEVTLIKGANGEPTYHQKHVNVATGQTVTQDIPIQKAADGSYKQFNIIYFVFEKTWPCYMYPPDNKVTFTNITIDFNFKQLVQPSWTTAFVDDNCNNRAHIDSADQVSITWNSQGQSSAQALKNAQFLRAPRSVLDGSGVCANADDEAVLCASVTDGVCNLNDGYKAQGTKCAEKILESSSASISCYEGLGLSSACAQAQTGFAECSSKTNCAFPCGVLHNCQQCDQCMSGASFKKQCTDNFEKTIGLSLAGGTC